MDCPFLYSFFWLKLLFTFFTHTMFHSVINVPLQHDNLIQIVVLVRDIELIHFVWKASPPSTNILLLEGHHSFYSRLSFTLASTKYKTTITKGTKCRTKGTHKSEFQCTTLGLGSCFLRLKVLCCICVRVIQF